MDQVSTSHIRQAEKERTDAAHQSLSVACAALLRVCRECENLLAEEAEAKGNRPALKLDDAWPKDLPMRVDEDGISWADYRPEKSDAATSLHAARERQRNVVGCFAFDAHPAPLCLVCFCCVGCVSCTLSVTRMVI